MSSSDEFTPQSICNQKQEVLRPPSLASQGISSSFTKSLPRLQPTHLEHIHIKLVSLFFTLLLKRRRKIQLSKLPRHSGGRDALALVEQVRWQVIALNRKSSFTNNRVAVTALLTAPHLVLV